MCIQFWLTVLSASKIKVLESRESLREDTVATLWKQLQQVRVIHARGSGSPDEPL
jgi:hypothetical protein